MGEYLQNFMLTRMPNHVSANHGLFHTHSEQKVNQELDRLEKAGVIEPIQFTDWAAPIVPVLKRDGSLRICGDYKVTVNRAAKLDAYPIPRIDDLFASLTGGKKFSKLDLAHAYQQIPLDEESQKLVINMSKGLFRYNQLPFGVASAPKYFNALSRAFCAEFHKSVST